MKFCDTHHLDAVHGESIAGFTWAAETLKSCLARPRLPLDRGRAVMKLM